MADTVSNVPSDFDAQKKMNISRQADASARAFVNQKESSLGIHAVVIKESEHLGPQAYNADGAGMRAMEAHQQAYAWASDRPPGMLEGSASTKPPQSIYVLWAFKDGELWMKIINSNWEAMQETIRINRAEMKEKMYQQVLRQNFKDLVDEIVQSRSNKLRKLSVVTYASDDFSGGSSGKRTIDEASPKDINPK
jgi:hypothetical protein